MKLSTFVKCVTVLAVATLAASVNAQGTPAPKSEKEKASYSLGVDMAKNFKRMGMDLDVEALFKGFRDASGGGKLLMTDEEMQTTLQAFEVSLRQKQAEASKAAVEANKKTGAAYLAANKAKPGVVTLPSGLQYKIIKAGDGKKPTAADTVECHYRGTLLDGTEFDSSYSRAKPASFKVSGVIAGWTEALQLMPVGSKWQLVVPAELAYGPQGAGGIIGPNATLVFEVELLGIK